MANSLVRPPVYFGIEDDTERIQISESGKESQILYSNVHAQEVNPKIQIVNPWESPLDTSETGYIEDSPPLQITNGEFIKPINAPKLKIETIHVSGNLMAVISRESCEYKRLAVSVYENFELVQEFVYQEYIQPYVSAQVVHFDTQNLALLLVSKIMVIANCNDIMYFCTSGLDVFIYAAYLSNGQYAIIMREGGHFRQRGTRADDRFLIVDKAAGELCRQTVPNAVLLREFNGDILFMSEKDEGGATLELYKRTDKATFTTMRSRGLSKNLALEICDRKIILSDGLMAFEILDENFNTLAKFRSRGAIAFTMFESTILIPKFISWESMGFTDTINAISIGKRHILRRSVIYPSNIPAVLTTHNDCVIAYAQKEIYIIATKWTEKNHRHQIQKTRNSVKTLWCLNTYGNLNQFHVPREILRLITQFAFSSIM